MVRFDLGLLLEGQTRTTRVKSAYNLHIIGLRDLVCEKNLQDWAGNLLMWSEELAAKDSRSGIKFHPM